MQLVKKRETYKRALEVLKAYHLLPAEDKRAIREAYESLEPPYQPYIKHYIDLNTTAVDERLRQDLTPGEWNTRHRYAVIAWCGHYRDGELVVYGSNDL